MTKRLSSGFTIALVALLSGRCGDRPVAPSPSRQTPTVPAPPAPPSTSTYRINAEVSAPDFSPVVGAQVEVIDGPHAGVFCTSDRDGRCTLPAMFSGAPTPQVQATSDAFNPRIAQFPSCCLGGEDTTIYFRLTTLATPPRIAGSYSLTVRPSRTCPAFEPEARTWSNTVEITQREDDPGSWASIGILPRGNPPECGFYGGIFGSSLGFIADPDCGFPTSLTPATVAIAPGVLLDRGRGRGQIDGPTIVMALAGEVIAAGGRCEAADHELILERR